MEAIGWLFGALAAVAIATMTTVEIRSWLRDPERKIRRAAGKLPLTPLEDVVAGQRVKVKGFLEYLGPPPLKAPITGRKCAGCRVEVFKEENDEAPTMFFEDSALADFALRSPSGALALVRLGTSRLGVDYRITRESQGGACPPSEEVLRLFEKHHMSFVDGLTYSEAVLMAAVEVTVIGVADREPDPRAQTDYRSMAPTRVIFQKTPLRISYDT